jgi:hypothetical protein
VSLDHAGCVRLDMSAQCMNSELDRSHIVALPAENIDSIVIYLLKPFTFGIHYYNLQQYKANMILN